MRFLGLNLLEWTALAAIAGLALAIVAVVTIIVTVRLARGDRQRIGTICCSDGEYPEAVRALAFNGAEVVYRPSEAVPMTQTGMEPGGTWLLQNRAHARSERVGIKSITPHHLTVTYRPAGSAPARPATSRRPSVFHQLICSPDA